MKVVGTRIGDAGLDALDERLLLVATEPDLSVQTRLSECKAFSCRRKLLSAASCEPSASVAKWPPTSMPVVDFFRGIGFLASHSVWMEINNPPAEWLTVALRSSPGTTRLLRSDRA